MPPSDSSSAPAEARAFATTRWSVVLRAGAGSAETADALSTLCRAYWYPLYAFVRRTGQTPHDAQELTQEFFARLVEKEWLADVDRERGRFRSWLLAAMKHFLAKEWRDSQREKRGGGAEFVPLDTVSAEERYAHEPGHTVAAEQIYDRRWALDLLDRGLARLEAEFATAEKAAQFAALKFSLTGEKVPLAEVAAQLGMNEGAVKVAIHRLRERYRDLIRDEIAETVTTPEDVDAELAELFASIGSIVFALFYLAKLTDAAVWEAYSQPGAYWTIDALLYFGVMILWVVRRERHAQLFGRDSGATDARHVPADLAENVVALLRAGTPADAFRLYRVTTGCTMADARTAVDNLAKQGGMPGIPAAKISALRLAFNFAITVTAGGIALYFISPEVRWPVLIQFSAGWIFMAVTMTALHFKGFLKNGLPRIVAMIGLVCGIDYESHASPGHFQVASTVAGMVAGAVLVIAAHKTARTKS
jgi:RNA polymerase sigma-70 factor (ECF subfamily)